MKTHKQTLFLIFWIITLLISCSKEIEIQMVQIPNRNYKIMPTEVTQGLYKKVMKNNPSFFQGKDNMPENGELQENRPVERVSWYDAVYFCNKLSSINGLEPVYSVDGKTEVKEWKYVPHKGEKINGVVTQNKKANGYRLPTVLEWKYASFGDVKFKYSGSDSLDEVAWYDKNSSDKTHEVAKKKENSFGLFDMGGNVWEWCWDSLDQKNCICGGYWLSYDKIGSRVTEKSEKQDYGIGFRLVCSTQENPLINDLKMVEIPNKNYKILSTEVTQEIYTAVMNENPSYFFDNPLNGEIQQKRPVDSVSWYDAIYFCNLLSEKLDLEPVYSVNGNTDVYSWNYIPHEGAFIKDVVLQNMEATGYRLPTGVEYSYATIDVEKLSYIDTLTYSYLHVEKLYNEIAWPNTTNDNITHEVGKKQENFLGIYDLYGNVSEWCWESVKYLDRDLHFLWSNNKIHARIISTSSNINEKDIGFRIACSIPNSLDEIVSIDMINIPGKKIKMSLKEITQKDYESIMKENPSYFQSSYRKPTNGELQENRPVEQVSWYDAIYFCNLLSIKEGLEPVYSVDGKTDVYTWGYVPHKECKLNGNIEQNLNANGYRLPTVEEWQYAARGGEDLKYAGSNNIDEVAWYRENSNDKTHEVGKKKANGYGLYDMSGNVGEWCWDSDYIYYRFYCGGSWYDDANDSEVDYQYDCNAKIQNYDLGFRIVCSQE